MCLSVSTNFFFFGSAAHSFCPACSVHKEARILTAVVICVGGTNSSTITQWWLANSWFLEYFGKVDGQFLCSLCGCRVRFLMRTPCCTSGRRRFRLRTPGRLLALFLPVASFLCGLMTVCLELTAGFFSLMNANCAGRKLLVAMTDGHAPASCLSLQPVFVTLSWPSTRIMLSLLEFAEGGCFRHTYVFHPCDVASPGQLLLKHDRRYAGHAGSLENFFVWHIVLPLDAKDGTQATLVKALM